MLPDQDILAVAKDQAISDLARAAAVARVTIVPPLLQLLEAAAAGISTVDLALEKLDRGLSQITAEDSPGQELG